MAEKIAKTTIASHPFFESKITKSKYGILSNKHTKNTLRTRQAQKGVKFKNIEPKPKITGSYKIECIQIETLIRGISGANWFRPSLTRDE